MGGICPCPKRRAQKQFAYDVHQQTFEMEENAQNIGENSPKNEPHDEHDNNVLTQELRSSEQGLQKLTQTQYQKSHSNNLITSFISNDVQKESKNQSSNQHKMEEQSKEPQKLNQNVKQQQPIIQQKPKFHANILKPKTVKKKYNPDDYRFLNQNQSFKVKKIDSIKQQQFNIDKCNNCQFFIFDITANIYIDDCENCFIFIAPCQSTIFVRNCKNMCIIAATKQFRTYQCHNSTFSLYCKSQPVIESSSQLIFTSFSCPVYQQLQKQATKKKFEPWNNHWSQIHNFTKKQGEMHFKLQQKIDFSKINWTRAFEQAQILQTQLQNPFPLIIGDLHYQIKRQLVILINKNVENQQIRKILNGSIILKAFQGVLAGHGKQQRKVVLIDAADNIIQKYEELGTIFTDQIQIQQKKKSWFISFGDQRQK